jgi:hypothetical protein
VTCRISVVVEQAGLRTEQHTVVYSERGVMLCNLSGGVVPQG